MKLSEITAENWTLSLATPGGVVQGIDEINQAIMIVVKTQKGSDPCRPTFGSDLYLYVDKPVIDGLPKMIKAVIDGINTWIPRIDILKITHSFDADGKVEFGIDWQEKISEISGTAKITANGSI